MFSINSLGVISVDTSELKTDVENAYKNALGNTLNLDVSTPQGQLIQSDIEQLQGVQDEMLTLVNSFSVLYAIDEALDRAGAFFGYYRKVNTYTIVQGLLYGDEGTVIDMGSLVSNGIYEFELLESVVIPASGEILGNFQCTTAGNITCLANTLTTIVSTKTGWDSVNNEISGINGVDEESDNTFRQRITANNLNILGKGMLGAIIDNVAQITGVTSVVGRENFENTPQTIDGVYMKAHSLFLTVLGGTSSEIAEILNKFKTTGTAMNGDVIITYFDTNVDYAFNYVIYRPTFVNMSAEITYSANYYTPVDIEDLIKETLLSYIVDNPFTIGKTISGNDLANAFDDFNYMSLLSLKVKITGEATYEDYIGFTLQEIAVLDISNIEIVEV